MVSATTIRRSSYDSHDKDHLTAGSTSMHSPWNTFSALASLAMLVLLYGIAPASARDVTMYTQTNITAENLIRPDWSLPFTSILAIGPGSNATEQPMTTIRIVQAPLSNDTGEYMPQILLIEHASNFTMPNNINAPKDIAWTATYIGDLPENFTGNSNTSVVTTTPQSNETNYAYVNITSNSTGTDPNKDQLVRTWGAGVIADWWAMAAMSNDLKYQLGHDLEKGLFNFVLDRFEMAGTEGAVAYDMQLEASKTYYGNYRLGEVSPDSGPPPKFIVPNEDHRMAMLQPDRAILAQRVHMTTATTGDVFDITFDKPVAIGPNKGVQEGRAEVKWLGSVKDNFLERTLRTVNSFVPGALSPTDAVSSWGDSRAIATTDTVAVAGCRRSLGVRGCAPRLSGGRLDTDISVVRHQSTFSTMSLISKEAALWLDETVRALAICIVILDFIDGRYVGGALGAIGVAVASLTPMFVEGPIGIILGTALALLFFILPGIFHSEPTPPHVHNNTQIVQYAFFGDENHTGNEQCAKGYKSCIASYGPGVIAHTFKWEYYDAVAFLIWANKGFPMTIPDIAKAFVNATFGNTQNASVVAGITCGGSASPPKYPTPDRESPPNYKGSNGPILCGKPAFYLNRTLINLPNINQTAADVYSKIIGDQGGSCKIIDNIDNPVTIPNYNIRIKGLPVAIACGINASDTQSVANVAADNVTSLVSMTTNGTTTNTSLPVTSSLAAANASWVASHGSISPGSMSTDNRTGEGYVPAPLPTPFNNSLTVRNAACFTSPQQSNGMCFPNGTLPRQLGAFNLFSTKATGLSLPPNSKLILTYNVRMNRGIFVPRTETYTPDKASGKDFVSKIQTGVKFDILIPSVPPPVVCLYTAANFAGDATCIGVGGGNMTEGVGKVASVGIYGGAKVTLYPHTYGDIGGVSFTVSIADLTTVPYGTNANMKDHLTALLVQPGGSNTAVTSNNGGPVATS